MDTGKLWECSAPLRHRIPLLRAFKDERCLEVSNTLVNRPFTARKQFFPQPLPPRTLLPSRSNERKVNAVFLQAFAFFGDPRPTKKKIKSSPKAQGYLFL